MLRVIPFLTKNRHMEQAEYLVDKRGQSFGAIAHVHIAEVLAGVSMDAKQGRTMLLMKCLRHFTNYLSLTTTSQIHFKDGHKDNGTLNGDKVQKGNTFVLYM